MQVFKHIAFLVLIVYATIYTPKMLLLFSKTKNNFKGLSEIEI